MNKRMIRLRAIVVALTTIASLRTSAGQVEPVSVADSRYLPAGGNGDSWTPNLSPDGRFVLFASTANNLLSLDGTNALPARIRATLNVFLRDRTNGVTLLASLNATGTGGGSGDSLPDGISADGRYALFESAAEDLIANDTNQATDVFVRDFVNGITRLVSVSTNGTSGNGESGSAVLTSDGRYAAFVSSASDLVPKDTNRIPDVFLRDLQANTTALISKGAIPAAVGGGASEAPVLSSSGSRVAFFSTALNLAPGVTSTNGEVYLHDLNLGTTTCLSTNARALVESVFGSIGALQTICYNQTISADGKFVTYEASENATMPGMIIRHNVETGGEAIVATNAAIPNAIVPAYADFRSLDMTPDGRFIAYIGNAGAQPGTGTCIYVWDAQTGMATLASADLGGAAPPGALCNWPLLDAAGEHVIFASDAPGLTTNTPYGGANIYIRNLLDGITTLVNEGTNGSGTFADVAVPPSLSADGSEVAFDFFDGSLAPHDNNHVYDVAVRNVLAGSSELISVRDSSLPATTPNADIAAFPISADFDGGHVAFASDADNLISNDNNGLRDVFVRDLVSGTNILVSVASDGTSTGDNLSTEPAISGNGRFVVFSSLADDLVAGDDNQAEDVFVRDLQDERTILVSVSTNGASPGSEDSFHPAISDNGRYVLFHSLAGNLASGLIAGTDNLIIRDLQANTNYALTTSGVDAAAMTPDGRYVVYVPHNSNASISMLYVRDVGSGSNIYTHSLSAHIDTVAISGDGNRVAYLTNSVLRYADPFSNSRGLVSSNAIAGPRQPMTFSSDGRFLVYVAYPNHNSQTNLICLYDFERETNILVTHRFDSFGPVGGFSDYPVLSADGRFVAYRSGSEEIVPGDSNGLPDIFLFDRLTGATTLVSVNRTGLASADNRSLLPAISGDGRTLIFESWASDMVASDLNQNSDLFAFKLTAPPVADSDGDGIDDQWELDYFQTLERNGTGDLDGDGASDLFEFLTGTDPTDPKSLFRGQITFEAASGQPRMEWPVFPGKAYRVEFKNGLDDTNWHPVQGNVSIINRRGYFTDPTGDRGQRYYRIVLDQSLSQ